MEIRPNEPVDWRAVRGAAETKPAMAATMRDLENILEVGDYVSKNLWVGKSVVVRGIKMVWFVGVMKIERLVTLEWPL